MGALAPWHWVVIILVILLLFGGRLLPRLGGSLGKSLSGLKQGLKEGSEQFKTAVTDEPKAAKPAVSESATSQAQKSESTHEDS